MVARIKTGKSLAGATGYNEQKVRQGSAQVIGGEHLVMEAEQMTSGQRLNSLQKLASLRGDVKSNTLHIFLSFAKEDRLEKAELRQIAAEYMEGIRLGGQPYVLYQHFDTASPHIHIVSTNVTDEGQRIDLNGVGRRESEKVRKEIELRHGLTPACRGEELGKAIEAPLVPPLPTHYGENATKETMERVLQYVTAAYKIETLAELNVVLSSYHLRAVQDLGTTKVGAPQKKGIVISFIDARGNRLGIPLKASELASKPTLSRLETLFAENKKLKEPLRQGLQERLYGLLDRYVSITPENLKKALEEINVSMSLRKNAAREVIGVTYQDLEQCVVFNGGALGREAGVGRIERLLGAETISVQQAAPWLNLLATAAERLGHQPGRYAFRTQLVKSPPRAYFEQVLLETTPDLSPREVRQLTDHYLRGQWQKMPELVKEDRAQLTREITQVLQKGGRSPMELEAAFSERGISLVPVSGGLRFQVGGDRGVYQLYLPKKAREASMKWIPDSLGQEFSNSPLGVGAAGELARVGDDLLSCLLAPTQEEGLGPIRPRKPRRRRRKVRRS